MLYGSKAWHLGQNEIENLQRTEKVMMRSMCGVKLMGKNLTKDLMQMLDLNKTIDHLTRANSVRWHGNVLRKDKNNLLRKAFDCKVKWTRKRPR